MIDSFAHAARQLRQMEQGGNYCETPFGQCSEILKTATGKKRKLLGNAASIVYSSAHSKAELEAVLEEIGRDFNNLSKLSQEQRGKALVFCDLIAHSEDGEQLLVHRPPFARQRVGASV